MTTDAGTSAFYDRRAADYAKWSADISGRELVHRFIAFLPVNGTALDLGCGSGWAAAEMAANGLSVKALDASVKLAAEARAAYGLEVEIAQFSSLSAEAEFDGVWASFSLLHTPREEMLTNLGLVAHALKVDGWFYLGLKAGAGTIRDDLGRFYQLYSSGEISSMLAAAGFVNVAIETTNSAGYDGTETPVLHIFARKGAG